MKKKFPSDTVPRTVNEDEIERLIYEAIDEADDFNPNQGGNIYYDLPESKADETGIETIRVRIEDGGRITTAHPEAGPNAYKWIRQLGDWERNYGDD